MSSRNHGFDGDEALFISPFWSVRFARAGIELREAQIRQLTDNLKQIKKQMEDLSVLKLEKGHLTSNQKQTLDNADRSITSLTDQVNTHIEELAKVKKKVGWRD